MNLWNSLRSPPRLLTPLGVGPKVIDEALVIGLRDVHETEYLASLFVGGDSCPSKRARRLKGVLGLSHVTPRVRYRRRALLIRRVRREQAEARGGAIVVKRQRPPTSYVAYRHT